MGTHERPARARNERGQGSRLRTEIVEAAVRIVDGSDAVSPLSLRGIAREAEVSAPSIYAHFPDVAAIGDAVLSRAFAELDRTVARAMEAQTTPQSALVEGCLAYVEYGWRHSSRYRFMVAAGGFAPDAVHTLERIEEALQQCIAGGSSTSTDARGDAIALWVAMHGMASLEKPARPELRRLGTVDREGLARTLVTRIAGLPGS